MAYLEEPRNPGLDDGKCALCRMPDQTEDSRCFGCGYLVCEDCCIGHPMGPHFVTEHNETVED